MQEPKEMIEVRKAQRLKREKWPSQTPQRKMT
jgi:hypothetical protein